MKQIANKIIDHIKSGIYNDDFNDVEFNENVALNDCELQIGENYVNYNFVAEKVTDCTEEYGINILSIHVTSLLNENNIERTNLIKSINNEFRNL